MRLAINDCFEIELGLFHVYCQVGRYDMWAQRHSQRGAGWKVTRDREARSVFIDTPHWEIIGSVEKPRPRPPEWLTD